MAEDALKRIHELFKDCFIQNCQLDEDEVNELELETLETLEPEEIFENLKELLGSLISFKKSINNSETKELTQRLVIFEKMIQKLESDIRNHISIEHQMRLDMETYEFKIEELQKIKQFHIKKIEDLDKLLVDKESEILHIKNKNALDLEIKLKAIEEKFKHEICSAMEYYRKDSGSVGRMEKTTKNLVISEIEKKNEEFNIKDCHSGRGKKSRFPKVIKEGITDRGKKTKKNLNAMELFKTIENLPKKDKKHESPYLKKEMMHMRSASDLGLTQKHKLTIL